MPVHSLQRGQKDAVGGIRNRNSEATDILLYGMLGDAPAQGDMFAGLSEASDMSFDRERQSGNLEIPLVRQPVSPTALENLRLKFALHRADNESVVRGDEQIEVAADIGPVIERLDYYHAPDFTQLVADRIDEGQSGCGALLLVCHSGGGPVRKILIPIFQG